MFFQVQPPSWVRLQNVYEGSRSSAGLQALFAVESGIMPVSPSADKLGADTREQMAEGAGRTEVQGGLSK